MVWLMPEEPLVSGKRFLYVKCPVPENNEQKVRQIYAEGVARGYGLLMRTLCELDGSTCCCIWYPKNHEEKPQGIWPQDGSVKMSANNDRIPGRVIGNQFLWKILAWRYRAKQNSKPLLFS